MNICGIYKITSPTGKVYIGQSLNVKSRFTRYMKLSCKAQTKIYNSLVKYGPENHTFEILHECRKEDLNKAEIEYIKHYNALSREYGLNLKEGGFNGNLSEETKDRIRQKAIGRKVSEETKIKMSKVRLGMKLPQEHKDNLKKALLKRCKQVIMKINENEEIIFDTLTEAARSLGFSQQSMWRALSQNKLYKGLEFRYSNSN